MWLAGEWGWGFLGGIILWVGVIPREREGRGGGEEKRFEPQELRPYLYLRISEFSPWLSSSFNWLDPFTILHYFCTFLNFTVLNDSKIAVKCFGYKSSEIASNLSKCSHRAKLPIKCIIGIKYPESTDFTLKMLHLCQEVNTNGRKMSPNFSPFRVQKKSTCSLVCVFFTLFLV